MIDEPTQPLDRVLHYPAGLNGYFTATVLRNFVDRFVPGMYYVVCFNFHGIFIVELTEALSPEEAVQHKTIVLSGFEEGVVMTSYLMKCISNAGLDTVVHREPFNHTVPYVMSFNEACTDYTAETIH